MSCEYLVSIIIPTYNHEKFLKASIDSALNQTYPRVEVVVVDDCSVDGTQNILMEYGDKIRSYKQERNMGQSAARNVGIENATGQWLKFHDSDDVLDRDAVENIISFVDSIDKQDRNKSIILNQYYIQEDELSRTVLRDFNLFDSRQKILAILSGLISIGSFSGHRDVFVKNKFDEALMNSEDFELVLRCATSEIKVWDLDRHTYLRVIHTQQISQRLRTLDANKLSVTVTRATLARLPLKDQIWYGIHMMRGEICGIRIRKWRQIQYVLTYIFPAPISARLVGVYMHMVSGMRRRLLHKENECAKSTRQ